MSKRKNPASKEGQDVVNLLTHEGNQANANIMIPPANVKGTNEVDQANAKNDSSISKSNNQADAINVSKDTEKSTNEISPVHQNKEVSIDLINDSNKEINDAGSNRIEKGKGMIQIDDSYKELLGSKPNANATENLTPSIIVTQQMKDLDMTMDRATAAVLAGNKEEAAFLFRIHEQMKAAEERLRSSTTTLNPTSVSLSVNQEKNSKGVNLKSNPIIILDENNLKQPNSNKVEEGSEIVENGFTFREGASTNTDSNVGLTPFFKKNIKELKLPVPLTIFNEEWQEEAWQYHTEKKAFRILMNSHNHT
ncbi:uncharacterized protein MELLADRAFT_69980 [Melampsora larici-populina 98AG31]|uniref:Uncharacterized protein n=1 Tax=Melampsora larici-populina (strain 98AG31 / pathotype 3-4-7) TaxID=747676 RepID=F4SD14_MELLP|nr:uncharacterized protein MELLADRAFT_69980 [Melampsora larici-populina 98AG31]EGF97462.1 hypothetical protein MELLADRAFT_69980 [Melampsora larici-populina 98AG31]